MTTASQKSPLRGHWLFESGIPELARKVGVTPEARLRWVVEDFARCVNYSALPADVTPVSVARAASLFLLHQLGAGTFDMTAMPHLPPAVFEDLAKEVSAGLDLFMTGKGWTKRITVPLERTVRLEASEARRNVYHALSPIRRGFPVMFALAVMDLLQDEGWRVARCARKECGTRFVRADKRQDYCSARCSQTTRTARFRGGRKDK